MFSARLLLEVQSSGVRFVQSGDYLEQRGFADAGRSYERDDVTLSHGKADIVQNRSAVK